VLFLLMGLAAIAWAGYSLITGKGYYKGCPPGGFDRTADPFSFWAPTIIILALGVFLVLNSLGVIALPRGRYDNTHNLQRTHGTFSPDRGF
jgi:hypothetical protein